jgi:hypothetical protein
MTTIDRWISELVPNKTFADVGFLWGIQNEKLSMASRCGAKTITGIDQWAPDSPLWGEFEHWMLGKNYNIVKANFLDHDGIYDFIHCSGVIYHCPDPITFLKKLKVSAKEYVVLTSMVTANHISNASGEMTIPDSSAVFVPALAGHDKEIIATEWNRILAGRPGAGLTGQSDFNISNYYDWWWLFTVPCLEAMCKACGFSIHGTELYQEYLYIMLLRT